MNTKGNPRVEAMKGSGRRMAERKIKCCILILGLTLFIPVAWLSSLFAQDAGAKLPAELAAEREGKIKLSLKDAIRIALLNNLDIAAEKYNPQVAQMLVAKAKSEFLPVAFTGIDGSRAVKPSSTSTFSEVVSSGDVIFNAGLRSKLITGGTVELRYDSDRNRTNSLTSILTPTYITNLSVILTQPMLRDYGITITRSDIAISENQKEISKIQLASKVNDIVARTEVAYWELISAIEIMKVRQRSLELAQELLRKNRAQVEVGVLAPVEVLAAEAVVAARKEGIITARVAIEAAEDELRSLMNPKEYKDMWSLRIEPTDKPPSVEQRASLVEALQSAFSKRYDYRAAKLDLDNRGIKVKVAKNGLLPRVDLVGELGLNGLSGETTARGLSLFGGGSPLDGGYSESLHELISGDFYSWRAGVSVEFPLGNVSQRSEYNRRRLEEEQARTNFHSLELVIQKQVRQAVRKLQGDLERVNATRVATDLAKERLEVAEKKLEVGISTSFEVLQLQEDLTTAENNAVRAIIDYNESLVELQRATATLLENKKIEID